MSGSQGEFMRLMDKADRATRFAVHCILLSFPEVKGTEADYEKLREDYTEDEYREAVKRLKNCTKRAENTSDQKKLQEVVAFIEREFLGKTAS